MRTPPPADTTHLYLIRHAATDANEQRPYILQGCGIDGPLSSRGAIQAAAAAEFLSPFPIRHVYASPMQRAQQTAAAIAGQHDLPVTPLDAIHECDVGHWEGLDWETIERDFPDEFRAFRENPWDNPYAGGESYGDVARRVTSVIGELLGQHVGESIAVIAHNVVNRVYLSQLMGLPGDRVPTIRQANGCVNFIRHARGETTLTTLNAMFHLDGLVD